MAIINQTAPKTLVTIKVEQQRHLLSVMGATPQDIQGTIALTTTIVAITREEATTSREDQEAVAEVEDGAEGEEGSEAVEVIGEVESLYREAGPSLTLPRAGTSFLRTRTEAGAEVARELTISTRGSCSNTGQVRARVTRRIRWSMVGRQDQGPDLGQDHDL